MSHQHLRLNDTLDDLQPRTPTSKAWLTSKGIERRSSQLAQFSIYRSYNLYIQSGARMLGASGFLYTLHPEETETGPCPDCEQFGGNYYRRGQFTPYVPRHPHCVCTLDPIFDEGDISRLINLSPDDSKSETYDNYARGKKRKIRKLESGRIGNTEILIINGPDQVQIDSFLQSVDDMKIWLKDVDEVKLINIKPPKIRRRTYEGTIEGYHVITFNPKNFEKTRQVIVYSKGVSPESIQRTTTHEMAHLVYPNIQSEHGAKDWSDFHKENKDLMPSDYAKRFGADEGFSESMAEHLTGGDIHPKIVEKLMSYGF